MTRGELAALTLADRRAVLGRLSFDECEALGYDECGLTLAECPGAPKPRPLAERTVRPQEFSLASAGIGRRTRPWAS